MMNLLKENRTLRELILGTWLFGVLAEIVLLFFPPPIYRTLGLAFGLIAASGMAIHMAHCIELSVSLDEKGANAYVRKMTILRYVAVCALLVVVALTGIGDPVSYVIGALGLKFGAYLQPLVHKAIGVMKKDVSDDTISGVSDRLGSDSEDTLIDINNDKGGE